MTEMYRQDHARGSVVVVYDEKGRGYEVWETLDESIGACQYLRGRTRILPDALSIARECAAVFDDLTSAD